MEDFRGGGYYSGTPNPEVVYLNPLVSVSQVSFRVPLQPRTLVSSVGV